LVTTNVERGKAMRAPTSAHYVLKTDHLFTPDEQQSTFWVEVETGRFKRILKEEPSGVEIVDAMGLVVAPGYIDVHTHGYGGHEIMEGTQEALDTMKTGLAAHGVTSFLPSTMCKPVPVLQEIMQRVPLDSGSEGARPLGWDLEGPFLSEKQPGIFHHGDFEAPTCEKARALLDVAPVKLIAIAPEVPGALPVIEYLVSRGVHVSLGHSDCTFDEAAAGIAAGATSINHLFNAMRPLHHREPGLVGAAFLYDVYLQFICDGVHSAVPTVALVSRYLKGRLTLISDSMLMAGVGKTGKMLLDGDEVIVDETSIRIANGPLAGRLAGSLLTMDQAVRNAVVMGGLDIASAFRCASTNPARSIGVDDRGVIRPGAIADIVVLTPDLHVAATICEGRAAYIA
jgi:N-acetylglucosamine-6-phosphate deacetylase